jgi:hypothetical protein
LTPVYIWLMAPCDTIVRVSPIYSAMIVHPEGGSERLFDAMLRLPSMEYLPQLDTLGSATLL